MSRRRSSPASSPRPRRRRPRASDGARAAALIDAWHRDGLLPVNGRDIVLKQHKYNVLDSSAVAAVCKQVDQDESLAFVEGYWNVANCTTQQHRIPSITGQEADEQ